MITIDGITIEDSERQETEIWTRCMGYHRPISQFNRGKKQEHQDRKPYTMERTEQHLQDNLS